MSTGRATSLGRPQLLQIGLLTAAAIALYAVVRLLPTGTNLSHMDFRVEGGPGSTIVECDPANPQFIPVVAVRSPVAMTATPRAPLAAGQEAEVVVRLSTASGKKIGPADLLVVHTRPLHLLVVDPSLTDYQHVHPEPGEAEGEWRFTFTPRFGGAYRLFADFTPAATGRGLYASADLDCAGETAPAAAEAWAVQAGPEDVFAEGGYVFQLGSSAVPLRAGAPADLALAITRGDGGAVPMEKTMDAYAHLVAFDLGRSGFAHLHPAAADLEHAPDAVHPRLSFQVSIPRPGRYVVWAQTRIEGRERFAPFPLSVVAGD